MTAQFQQARWNEPLLSDIGTPGERGFIPSAPEAEITARVPDALSGIPASFQRAEPPRLPEVAQPQLMRHFMRLSQETMGNDVAVDFGLGTCTMKYSPKVNEHLVRLPEVSGLHPLQHVDTVQGILEILWRLEQMLCAISGLDRFTLQPPSGSAAVYTNASIVRAYHRSRGEGEQRNEIISSIFSHPCDQSGPYSAGYKIIQLYPGPNGYPEVDALKAALSDRTAGIVITNPEDTGIYNPHIKEFTRLVHEAGGLCVYDQANANGMMGIARAKEAGFDLCHFNMHKTFSSPHNGMGPAMGASGVREDLVRFLPAPVVEKHGDRFELDWNRPESIGKIRSFVGNAQIAVRSYSWILALGPDGIREVAETAVLNANYLAALLREVPGMSQPFPTSNTPLEQFRWSLEGFKEETGVGSSDISRNLSDYGLQPIFTSHHPYLVPEPITPEPAESFSKADLDTFGNAFLDIAHRAQADPDEIINGPYNNACRRIDAAALDDPDRWVPSSRAERTRNRTPIKGD